MRPTYPLIAFLAHGRDDCGNIHVSLEEELFRQWLAEGRSVKAFVYSCMCFDIGTPERYRNAQERLAKAERETTLQKGYL